MSAESVEEFDTAFQNLIDTLLDGEVGLDLTSDAANTLAYAMLDTIDPTHQPKSNSNTSTKP